MLSVTSQRSSLGAAKQVAAVSGRAAALSGRDAAVSGRIAISGRIAAVSGQVATVSGCVAAISGTKYIIIKRCNLYSTIVSARLAPKLYVVKFSMSQQS